MVAVPSRSVLRAGPDFLRLWTAGGIANAMLWLEMLAASLFTLEVTGSGWAVAVVSAARSLPLLGFGALVGVAAEAWDRKRIVVGGLFTSAAVSAVVTVLASLGLLRPWHLGVAAVVSGFVYATEMPARRRMVAECAGGGNVEAAVALDSLTSYATRCLGPLAAGLLYGRFGLAGAYLISALANLWAAWLAAGIGHRQEVGALAGGRVGRDLRDGLAFARGRPLILALLAVTITMNLCGYSYATLIAPLGRAVFNLDPTAVGVLAAAEPAGAFAMGLVLTRIRLPGPGLVWLVAGVAVLLGGLAGAAAFGSVGPSFAAAGVALALGGCGSAVYTTKQTTLVMTEAPPGLRSRVMGLLTVCIGSWPLGTLLAGALVERLPPPQALATLAALGFALLIAISPLCLTALRQATAAAR